MSKPTVRILRCDGCDRLFDGVEQRRVLIVLAALLVVRGVPALLYRPLVGARRSVIAGLLQATSLTFIVAATQIGLVLGEMTKATGAALIAAGPLSVLIFPVLAVSLLRRRDPGAASQRSGAERV